MKYQDISKTIGNTPVVRLHKLFPMHSVWMKIEKGNPGGSLKDRIALGMIEDAEKKGILDKTYTIIEPTSGNTGIGLAMIAAIKNYKIILVMSEGMSKERVQIMKAYGAKIILTPKKEGTKGAIKKTKEMLKKNSKLWSPTQHENEVNIKTHIRTTAKEIIKDFPQGLNALITTSGTGGHISGLAISLKKHYSKLKVFAVEPQVSPVISGGKPTAHKIAGISPGFIPKNLLVDKLDEVITVSEKNAFLYTRQLASKEGILAGISTGAAVAAVKKFITKNKPSKNYHILTINYDTGERYLSVDGLF